MDQSTLTADRGPSVRVSPPPDPKREDRPIDAVILPRGYVGPGLAREQHARANHLFASLAGSKTFWWLPHDTFSFGVPNHGFEHYARDLDGASLYFGSGHPLAGQSRFEWYLAERQPDGTYRPTVRCLDPQHDFPDRPKFGYRVSDPSRDDPLVIQSARDHYQKQAETHKALLKAALADPELYESLKDKLGWSDAEMEVAFGHVDRIVT